MASSAIQVDYPTLQSYDRTVSSSSEYLEQQTNDVRYSIFDPPSGQFWVNTEYDVVSGT